MMEPTQFVKQAIDFQKKALDNSFTALSVVQDQAEQLISKMVTGNAVIPEGGQKIIEECFMNIKKGREDFQRAVTDGFGKVESFLEDAVNMVKK